MIDSAITVGAPLESTGSNGMTTPEFRKILSSAWESLISFHSAPCGITLGVFTGALSTGGKGLSRNGLTGVGLTTLSGATDCTCEGPGMGGSGLLTGRGTTGRAWLVGTGGHLGVAGLLFSRGILPNSSGTGVGGLLRGASSGTRWRSLDSQVLLAGFLRCGVMYLSVSFCRPAVLMALGVGPSSRSVWVSP